MRKEIMICDLCGQPITAFSEGEYYKMKKSWALWYERGWERIDVHKICRRKLFEAIHDKKPIIDKK